MRHETTAGFDMALAKLPAENRRLFTSASDRAEYKNSSSAMGQAAMTPAVS